MYPSMKVLNENVSVCVIAKKSRRVAVNKNENENENESFKWS
jgi:hypothetical protein